MHKEIADLRAQLAEREGEIEKLEGELFQVEDDKGRLMNDLREARAHPPGWEMLRDELIRERDGWQLRCVRTEDALTDAQARLARMREALEQYGVHKFGCKNLGKTQGSGLGAFVITDPEPCDCGLDDALADPTPAERSSDAPQA